MDKEYADYGDLDIIGRVSITEVEKEFGYR